MKKLPKKYIIVEIIPDHSNYQKGHIVQIQALKVNDDKIIGRLDLRVKDDLINNNKLLEMISYDKEMFKYLDHFEDMIDEFKSFIKKDKLFIIDNSYTRDYLKDISNDKLNIFDYLELEVNDNVFNELIKKYNLEMSNHLVDLLYEALIFAKKY